MTYKVCKVSTAATDVPGVYSVLFNGDGRFFRRIEIHLSRDLGDNVLDFIELYGLWCALVQFELAGHQRSCGNLKLVVSRGAVKRLLLSDSSKGELYETSNALRTQFFGLAGITVEKNKPLDPRGASGLLRAVGWDPAPATFGRKPRLRQDLSHPSHACRVPGRDEGRVQAGKRFPTTGSGGP
jgi:hypothetical protein